MDVKRQARLARDLLRQAERLDAPAREAADLGMCLDPLDQIAVGERGLDRAVDIDAVRAVQLGVIVSFHAADQIGRQKRIDAACGRLDDIAAEGREGHQAGAALIDQRRDAGSHADQIGVEPEAAGHVAKHMRVRIDQPGQ